MVETRPTLFIGSSTEGLEVAQNLRFQLREYAECTIWSEGLFVPGSGTLEALVASLDIFDFAILVLTPDDLTESRANILHSPRDNVLFECGLFMGRLGRFRTFVVFDKDQPIKLPSDLAGTNLVPYRGSRRDGNLLSAVGEACDPIRQQIKKLGVAPLSIDDGRIKKNLPTGPLGKQKTAKTRTIAWILGSYSGLTEIEARLCRKISSVLAKAMVNADVHAVMGNSDLLEEFANAYRDATLASDGSAPNAVMLYGKLRQCNVGQIFATSIGEIPQIAIVLGGGIERGRVHEEIGAAHEANIPTLTIPATGGAASTAISTVSIPNDLIQLFERRGAAVDVGDLCAAIVSIIFTMNTANSSGTG